MTDTDKLNARIALLNYSRNKISEHIQYVISLIILIFALNNIDKIPREISNFFSISLIGPLIYMFGRIFFWSSFTTAVFIVKPSSKERITSKRKEKDEFEEYNLLCAYNDAAKRGVDRDKTPFGKIAKVFYKSFYLICWTGISVALAIFYVIVFVIDP